MNNHIIYNHIIYTDGSCIGNPGPGGWAAVITDPEDGAINDASTKHRGRELSGREAETTNNRMELTAAIEALSSLLETSKVILRTDSKYLLENVTKSMSGWKNNDWVKADGKPPDNIDLWKKIDALNDTHEIQWEWVEAHSGDPLNEYVNDLALAESRKSDA